MKKIKEKIILKKSLSKFFVKNGGEYFGEMKDGLPNGQGIITGTDKGKTTSIEEGIFEQGYLIKGSEILFLNDFIVKEIGRWRLEKGVCSESISGLGKRLYYKTKVDLKNNNYFGYEKGVFDYFGHLMKGEILNPTLIGHSTYKTIKKIILTGKIQFLKNIEFEGSTEINSGEIFYEIDQESDGSDKGQFKKYKGEIDYDVPHGKGTMIYEDGAKYVGQWDDGLRNGQGTFTWPDGEKYVGEYKHSNKHGQGTYTYPNGAKHVGEYKDGDRNGQGTFTYPDEGKYVGEFKNDIRNGQGTFTYFDGEKCVGEFKDGYLNGQGTFTYPDGAKYVGEFKNHIRNGQGTFTYPDGKIEKGIFKNGKFIK